MTGNPLVSIRCLVYNHEPYLRRCLDGFVMQKTNFPFEAIVHDDASTDGSAAIIREYAEKYPSIIKPIYETENQYSKRDDSLVKSMDAAMHLDSKYVALCEGDDYWTDPDKLQKQVDALESHPECTIAFSRVHVIDKDGNEIGRSIPENSDLIPNGVVTLDDYMMSEFYHGCWTFHTSTFLYRKSCLELHRELKKTVFVHYPYGDQPMLLSCLFQGNGFYLPDVTGRYRWLSGGYNSTIRKNPQNEIISYEKRIRAWKDLDAYTQGKYSQCISRACDRFSYLVLKTRYSSGMMTTQEKISFLFYGLWRVRRSFSTIKLSLIEFVSCVYPKNSRVVKNIKDWVVKKFF